MPLSPKPHLFSFQSLLRLHHNSLRVYRTAQWTAQTSIFRVNGALKPCT